MYVTYTIDKHFSISIAPVRERERKSKKSLINIRSSLALGWMRLIDRVLDSRFESIFSQYRQRSGSDFVLFYVMMSSGPRR
jgi:hypothetical protein